jgi:hypothetical protein
LKLKGDAVDKPIHELEWSGLDKSIHPIDIIPVKPKPHTKDTEPIPSEKAQMPIENNPSTKPPPAHPEPSEAPNAPKSNTVTSTSSYSVTTNLRSLVFGGPDEEKSEDASSSSSFRLGPGIGGDAIRAAVGVGPSAIIPGASESFRLFSALGLKGEATSEESRGRAKKEEEVLVLEESGMEVGVHLTTNAKALGGNENFFFFHLDDSLNASNRYVISYSLRFVVDFCISN